jgi:uncharacterized ferritin-like protein (DUF455 family)
LTPLPPLTPELFGPAPAREAHVPVVERWAECMQFEEGDPDRELEFVHRQMNEEVNVLENAAASLVDFPDADWEIRMWLARQCSDEARHVLVYKSLVERRGGRVGQFPVMNFQYRIVRAIDSLLGRLAVQNRTFEADGLDAAMHAEVLARSRGDDELAAIYASQAADEIVHVGFANAWIRRQVRQDPRNLMHIARALARGTQAFLEVAAGGGADVTAYGVAQEERRLAGFEPNEIEVAHTQAEARRAAARARAGAGA